jgi:uncharacterized membrane protein
VTPERRWRRRVLVAAAAFWLVVLALAGNRYLTFASTQDQGTFNQVFWNGLHGRFFQGSLSSTLSYAVIRRGEPPDVSYRRLGQHFTPALLLWLPLYALWPGAAFLIVLQATLVAAGGLVLYGLARERLEPAVAGLIALAYYAAQGVIGPALSNFHDLCQVPVCAFGLLWALERRRWTLVWILAALLLAVREDTGMVLIGVGLYLLATRRHPRLGAALLVASAACMLVVTGVVMPRISPDISGRFMVERFPQILGGREASTLDLVTALALRPWMLLRELVTPVGPTLHYLIRHFVPLAFVPAVSGASWLAAGPVLAGLFVQGDSFPLQANVRYALTVVPGVFYGAVVWWSRHAAAIERAWLRRFWIGCAVASAIAALASNPHGTLSFLLPEEIRPGRFVPLSAQWERGRALWPLVRRVPPDASVSASIWLIPQLSSRRAITRYPHLSLRDDAGEVRPADFVAVDVPGWRGCDPAALERRGHVYAEVARVRTLIARERYGAVAFAAGVVLAQRGAPHDPAALAAWSQFLARCYPRLAARAG